MVGGAVLTRLWTDTCAVFVREPFMNEGGVTELREVKRYEGLPCRLSFFQSVWHHAEEELDGTAASIRQIVKLFLPLDVEIPPGSRICVVREGREMDFCASGFPMVFSRHQVVVLENFEKWA